MYESFSFSGQSVNCYGLEITKRILERHNITVMSLDYNTSKPVLVSLYWPEQIYDFIKWRYAGHMKHKQVIVGGNYPTTSPSAVIPFADWIFLGDSENWSGQIDSPFIVKKNEAVKKSVAEYISSFVYEDVQTTRRSFVEISRGCKNRCLFCQYGWLKPYREVSFLDISEAIRRASTKTIRVFAADRFQHTNYLRIRELLEKIGKCDSGSDLSLRFVLKKPHYLKYTNKVRVGIEGTSERLRSLINKPYTDAEIIEFCRKVADAGIKCLDFYMIYGLPTENEEDVRQFQNLLIQIDSIMPKGYVIAIHWNAFTPSAQTPFQWEAPANGYYYYYDNFFKDVGNKHIKIYNKPKFTSQWTIIKRMLAIRGSENTKELLYTLAFNESKLKKNPDFLLREYEKRTCQNLLDAWPIEKPLPWDKYCIYPKKAMYSIAMYRKNKYGSYRPNLPSN